MYIPDLVVFIISLVILVKGADLLVDSISYVAEKIGVSEFIIGLTVVSIGTTLPELAVSISASLNQDSGIVAGNILGSSIANIGLILALAVIFHNYKIKREIFDRDGFFLLFAVSIFLIFSLDHLISLFEGILLLFAFIAYMYYLIKHKGVLRQSPATQEEISEIKEEQKTGKWLLVKNIGLFIAALAMVVIGAKFIVPAAESIAKSFGISDTVIGLSAIAIGTSLPELTIAISATKKNHANLMIGNLFGSCIMDFVFIAGISALINPISLDLFTQRFVLPFLVFLVFALMFFMRTEWRLKHLEGYMLYAAYIIFLIIAFIYRV